MKKMKRRCLFVVLALVVVFGSVSVASAFTHIGNINAARTSNTSASIRASIDYSKTLTSCKCKFCLLYTSKTFRPGEFVMTTLSAFRENPTAAEEALKPLVQKGVCAICIKTVYFNHVSSDQMCIRDRPCGASTTESPLAIPQLATQEYLYSFLPVQ